ncbi:hypothetical protein ACHQM5_000394 [Ranunculus cassubicifolius]
MNAMAWNCRGSGTPATISEIIKYRNKYSLDICFLAETKDHSPHPQNRFQSLGFQHSWAVPSNGASGGLWLGWTDSMSLRILYSSERIIDTLIRLNPGDPVDQEWRCSFVYGHPDHSQRAELWNWLIMTNLGLLWETSMRLPPLLKNLVGVPLILIGIAILPISSLKLASLT